MADFESFLNRWQSAGLLDAETADRIRHYESGQQKPSGLRWQGSVALILGGLLCGRHPVRSAAELKELRFVLLRQEWDTTMRASTKKKNSAYRALNGLAAGGCSAPAWPALIAAS